ncbi:MAG: GGDEF domain-containing protein [Burkholderiales bacterium]|nr:GGDEF domain-containing protein [Burkholderiales bacterium]
MDILAIAFWGAFFGTVGLMLAASLFAFARSAHRVALSAAMSAAVSAFFVVAYLGWLPIPNRTLEARLLAHVAAISATILGMMLLSMLGLLRSTPLGRKVRLVLVALALGVVLAGWLFDPIEALAISSGWALCVGAGALAVCVRSAVRGDRLAWVAVSGVFFMLIAVSGLSWIALDGEIVSWPLHAVSAVAGMAYLSTMASALWSRYSYLIELREVMAHGPAYDPVTRMRSHAETGQMVGAAFFGTDGEVRPLGVIVVSIGNLYALEKLHGRAAMNHALFVCAGRLRRGMPGNVEMGRLGDDGFLLLTRNADDPQRLIQIARQIAVRLARPVQLSTSREPARMEAGQAEWVAGIGIGVLATMAPQMRPSVAVTMARAMSRTAWSYASHVAWFDQAANQIAEVPVSDVPPPRRRERDLGGSAP